jgi:hypothetical protein
VPLQNRVTPFGDLVAVAGRGTMMGNRGVLHDEGRRIVKAWAVRRWIACVLEFKNIRRAVMSPRRYTELFFLDEATSLSAGHRPCAECRRGDYRRFTSLWVACRPEPPNADSMDLRLHADRLDGKAKRRYSTDISTLPEGAYIALDGRAWLLWNGRLHAWGEAGYERTRHRPPRGEVEVLTPRALVDVIAAGYRPLVHPSAEDGLDACVK